MDAELMYWLICWRKAKTNFAATNRQDLLTPLVPVMFLSLVLDQQAPVVWWYSEATENLHEFPVLVPRGFFHEEMAADPQTADIDFLGRYRDLLTNERVRPYHFSILGEDIEYREEAFVVSGTLMSQHFIFEVARIAIRDTGLVAPRHYETRRSR